MPLANTYRWTCRLGLMMLLAGTIAACADPTPQSAAPVDVTPLGPPPIASTTPVRKPKVVHGHAIIVQPGESLGKIAETHHVSKQAIIAANKLSPPYEVKAGSRLVIPGSSGKGTKAVAETTPTKKPATKPVELAHAAEKPKPAAKPAKSRGASGDVIPLD